jgi:hypothetical protein
MKSIFKFIYHENEINNKGPFSHLIINSNSLTTDITKSLYLYKLQNRNIKTLFYCSIFFSEKLGVKDFIKFLTDNGFDGCIFESNNPYNYFHINKIINTCFQLPAPYNFNWEFYIDFSILNPKECILFTIDKIKSIPFSPNLRGFIMESYTLEKFDLSNSPNLNNIILTTNSHTEKEIESLYNKHNFRGIVINKFLKDFQFDSLSHEINDNEIINNIEYPTSNILRQLMSLSPNDKTVGSL